jgi:hypothetical protein
MIGLTMVAGKKWCKFRHSEQPENDLAHPATETGALQNHAPQLLSRPRQ